MTSGVTGCIVARDEAPLVGDCIASLRGAVDEIVVVDHGSRDATADVARELGARVIAAGDAHHEHARNAYLEAARTPWIFVIDADERLSTRGRHAIASHAIAAPPDVLGFAIERFDWIGGGRWASTRLVRLFRAHPRIRYFASRAHASVAPAIAALGGRIAFADAPVHHLDALLARDHAAKRARMRERLAAEIAASPGRAIMRCWLALELFAIDDDEAATAELARARADDERCAPIVHLHLAQQHRARGRLEDAAREASSALALESAVFRGRESAYVVLADAHDRLGRRDAATATMRAALAEAPALASHHLGLAALLEGIAPDEARAHAAAAREANEWISTPATLAEGASPCIFRQQDALLARVRTVR
jgi:hypothetical protein